MSDFFIFTRVQFLPLVRTHEIWYIRKSFKYNRKVSDNVGNKIGDNPITRKHGLNLTRERILSEMRHNPNITKAKLVVLLGINNTADVLEKNKRCICKLP